MIFRARRTLSKTQIPSPAVRRVKRFSSRNGFRAASLPPKPPDRRVTHILADDSGLEVDALNGAPGSSFRALQLRSIALARRILLTQRITRSCSVCSRTCPAGKRGARFRCVIAVAPVSPPVKAKTVRRSVTPMSWNCKPS